MIKAADAEAVIPSAFAILGVAHELNMRRSDATRIPAKVIGHQPRRTATPGERARKFVRLPKSLSVPKPAVSRACGSIPKPTTLGLGHARRKENRPLVFGQSLSAALHGVKSVLRPPARNASFRAMGLTLHQIRSLGGKATARKRAGTDFFKRMAAKSLKARGLKPKRKTP